MLYIIIPIYNVAKTLTRCVESIVSQSFQDWEMLLIDDGSTDESARIADDLASGDARISVYHKPNGGLSDARNYGIDIVMQKLKTPSATDKDAESSAGNAYISFVDSDDTLAPDTFLSLMTAASRHADADIIEFPVLVHAGHESETLLQLPERLWNSAREYWHATAAWEHTYAWNKIYRIQLFEDIRFAKGRIFEDAWFFPELLSHNPKVLTTSKGLYHYIWNDNGITVQASRKDIRQLLQSQIRGAWLMRTTPFSTNGRKLYRSMMCRLYDSFRLC